MTNHINTAHAVLAPVRHGALHTFARLGLAGLVALAMAGTCFADDSSASTNTNPPHHAIVLPHFDSDTERDSDYKRLVGGNDQALPDDSIASRPDPEGAFVKPKVDAELKVIFPKTSAQAGVVNTNITLPGNATMPATHTARNLDCAYDNAALGSNSALGLLTGIAADFPRRHQTNATLAQAEQEITSSTRNACASGLPDR